MKKTTKTINFTDRWDEFRKNAIDVLIRYLSDDITEFEKVQEVSSKQVFTNKEFMRLYKIIYDLCIIPKGNFAKLLYAKYIEVTSNYLLNYVLPDLKDKDGVTLLKRMANHWDKHMNIFVKWLGKWFRYLDQHYVTQFSLEKVSDKGESLFRANIFLAVKINLMNSVLEEFEKEREGEMIEYSVKEIIDMIIKFRTNNSDDADYYQELEDLLVKDTQRFYCFKGKEYLKEYTWEEYLTKVDKIIEDEHFRIDKYMTESGFDRFLKVINQELLVNNMEELLAKPSGLAYMLNNHVIKDIRLLYKLYCPLQDTLREIAQKFKIFISEKGNTIIDELEGEETIWSEGSAITNILESKFVDDVMIFCEKYISLLRRELQKDTFFTTSFESAFSSFLNRSIKEHTLAEILARSSEKVLKRGNNNITELQIYKYIDNITSLFSYMEDKDLFIEVYRWGLAKRLLDNKWASIDYEKDLIGKIKMSCGPQYTAKVEGMLSDVNNEKTLVSDFLKTIASKELVIEFDVKVLTDGYWPSFKTPPVILPQQLNDWVETFNKFYVEKNKMKHLSWSYMHGTCLVSATFGDSKQYDINITTYQTSILMLFNTHETLTISEIQELLKTEESLIRSMLGSLTLKKYKILAKTGEPKEITKNDIFRVNESFKSKLKLISISAPVVKETFNKEKVDIDRSHAIEAAIVKIMKSRKKMTYMHLSKEVMVVLQMFKPTGNLIKSKIEGLIDRDYLERDPNDLQVMKYKA